MATILIDVDGVVADMIGSIFEEINRELPNEPLLHPEIIKEWTFMDFLTPAQEVLALDIMARKGFARSLDVLPQSHQAIDMLRSAGHDVVWVTAPYSGSETWAHDRTEWLKDNFDPDIPLVTTSSKEFVDGDVLIDDKPLNIQLWEMRRKKTGILFEQPWNMNVAPDFVSMKGWDIKTIINVAKRNGAWF